MGIIFKKNMEILGYLCKAPYRLLDLFCVSERTRGEWWSLFLDPCAGAGPAHGSQHGILCLGFVEEHPVVSEPCAWHR